MAFYRCSKVADVRLGTKTISTNGTYNALSDSLDGYSSVAVNVSGTSIPSDLACGEVTLESVSASITFPYDTTKTPITVYVWMKDHNTFSSASKGFGFAAELLLSGEWNKASFYANGNGEQTISGSYGSITIDSTNGTIEVANRYDFPVATYDYIIQYSTT